MALDFSFAEGFLDIGLLAIAIVGLGGFGLILFYINRKYPFVHFLLTIDGTTSFKLVRYRLNGDEVVDDNIVQLLFHSFKVGADIKEFKRGTYNGKEVYLADYSKRQLSAFGVLPHGKYVFKDSEGKEIAVELPTRLVPTEISVGVSIGKRFVELLKSREAITEANKSLIMSIGTVAPIALLLVLTVIMGYVSFKALTDTFKEVVQPMRALTADLQALAAQLTSDGSYTPPKRYNATDTGVADG